MIASSTALTCAIAVVTAAIIITASEIEQKSDFRVQLQAERDQAEAAHRLSGRPAEEHDAAHTPDQNIIETLGKGSR